MAEKRGDTTEELLEVPLTKALKDWLKKKLAFKQKQWIVDAPLPEELKNEVDLRKGDTLTTIVTKGEDVTLKNPGGKLFEKKFNIGALLHGETILTFKRIKRDQTSSSTFQPRSRTKDESNKAADAAGETAGEEKTTADEDASKQETIGDGH